MQLNKIKKNVIDYFFFRDVIKRRQQVMTDQQTTLRTVFVRQVRWSLLVVTETMTEKLCKKLDELLKAISMLTTRIDKLEKFLLSFGSRREDLEKNLTINSTFSSSPKF